MMLLKSVGRNEQEKTDFIHISLHKQLQLTLFLDLNSDKSCLKFFFFFSFYCFVSFFFFPNTASFLNLCHTITYFLTTGVITTIRYLTSAVNYSDCDSLCCPLPTYLLYSIRFFASLCDRISFYHDSDAPDHAAL